MSMKFEDIAQFKIGQVFYENGYGQSVRFVLTTKPVINEDRLTFTGECENGEVDFMIHRKYPHYGPDISLEPEYVDINDIAKELSKWV